ncbi:MAG: hypothetical protein GOVbin4162_127 [Prokaryotic dsDNA virus sp.]|nr:MAG: hypothetical protein GOVbin4162_127 [Prokaryotic dsDNA virus sp.]|tara:strand:- start:3306 stop:3506 length:201 start_codon:yes stop_codon:yes gene_type:complete
MNITLFVYKPMRLTAERVTAEEAEGLLQYLETLGGNLSWSAIDPSTGMKFNMNNGEWVLKSNFSKE